MVFTETPRSVSIIIPIVEDVFKKLIKNLSGHDIAWIHSKAFQVWPTSNAFFSGFNDFIYYDENFGKSLFWIFIYQNGSGLEHLLLSWSFTRYDSHYDDDRPGFEI